jgi:hypothetical protein
VKRFIYLFSSNYRLKYLEDDLLTLLLPRDMAVHFRYLAKYVEPDLLANAKDHPGELIGSTVLISYPATVRESTVANAKASADRAAALGGDPTAGVYIYPLRFATLIGLDASGDMLHLYFSVTGYPTAPGFETDLASSIMRAHKKGEQTFHASFGEQQTKAACSTIDGDIAAFNAIADSFKREHWLYYENDGTEILLEPVFARVGGIRQQPNVLQRTLKPGSLCKPRAIFGQNEKGYSLRGGRVYSFTVSFRQPKWSKLPEHGASLVLTCDEKLMASPAKSTFDILSFYDTAELYIIPRETLYGWNGRSSLSLEITGELGGHSGIKRKALAADWNCWLKTTPRFPPLVVNVIESLYSIVPLLAIIVSFVARAEASLTPNAKVQPVTTLDWILLSIVVVVVIARAVIRGGT